MSDNAASRDTRGFFAQIELHLDEQSRRFVGGWDSKGPNRIRRWLEGNALEFYTGSLKQPHLHTFPQLLAAYQKIVPHRYNPQDFAHESLPVHAWVECANKYGTPDRLLQVAKETPHIVSRDHVYLAYRLGLIDARELEKMPPKIHKGRFYKPRKRRKLKTAH